MQVFADILSNTIVFAIPLLLVALGGVFSERSGVINIALEGIMLIGALVSCLVLREFNLSGFGPNHPQLAVFIAILAAIASGMIFSLLLAFAAVHLKADQTISGTALNMLAPALALVISWAVQGQGQTTILIPEWVRIGNVIINNDTNFFVRVFMKSAYLTTPVAIILFILCTILLYKTTLGLRLRSCGEHPQASASVGINVYKMRYIGVIISGGLAGLGGLAYTLVIGAGFQSTVAGYGFLALAVMIFGNWKPLNILFASLFFAFFKTIGDMATSLPFIPTFNGVREIQYLYLMIPYIFTLVILALTSKRSRAPKAEGQPYDKGKR